MAGTDADRRAVRVPVRRERVHAVRRGRPRRWARPRRDRTGGAAGSGRRVGDLFALHEEAGIELRLLANLWPFCDEVTGSGQEFSGIRLRNALPRSME
ncbi:DUF6886 family protein [Lentzea sp. NPDC034063]|uniref:DUF6886 family protein n=1 Tax=unclassified Lentzea TaxID=2643253 RepID=UPI0034097CB3